MRIPEKTRRQKNVSAEMQEERNFAGTDYDVYVMEKKERGKVLLLCVLGAALCGYLYFHSIFRHIRKVVYNRSQDILNIDTFRVMIPHGNLIISIRTSGYRVHFLKVW